jgi:hypothetical protein
MKVLIAVAAIAITCIFIGSYVLASYHWVTYDRYYQVTGKYTYYHDGTHYMLNLKGHSNVEVDSKNEWNALNKGNYYLVEWSVFERNIR